MHYAAGEHAAGQWTVDVAHLLHARGGESDLVSCRRAGRGDHEVDIAPLNGVRGFDVGHAGFRRQAVVAGAARVLPHQQLRNVVICSGHHFSEGQSYDIV